MRIPVVDSARWRHRDLEMSSEMDSEMDSEMEMSRELPSGHQGTSLPLARMASVLILTFVAPGLALWATTLFAPITLTEVE